MKLAALPLSLVFACAASAQDYRVNVLIENVAPTGGTFQTPVWIGFHDGTFDIYNPGQPASALPISGSSALERLAEDGATGPLSADFETLSAGDTQTTIVGPKGPYAPGDSIARSFLLDANDTRDRYFSYASMVLPSNDAFIANGSPVAHPMFDAIGDFIATDFFVAGAGAANDAGTELNDELPMNTAFFGQMAPDTGVTENNPIIAHPGFLPRGSGGILDDTRYRLGDFTLGGYPFMRFGFRAASAVTEIRVYTATAIGAFEVPATPSPGIAISGFALLDDGTRLLAVVQAFGLQDLNAAHLHLGTFGTNGPVVVDLLADNKLESGPVSMFFVANIATSDLVGPLSDFPLDEVVGRMEAGEIYLNLHTTAFPGGELRGQLTRAL